MKNKNLSTLSIRYCRKINLEIKVKISLKILSKKIKIKIDDCKIEGRKQIRKLIRRFFEILFLPIKQTNEMD